MKHMLVAAFVAISALCFAQPTGNFTRLRTYTSDDGRQYRDEYTTYDIMGNALSVRRNGLLDDGTYGPIDDLTLQYEGNRLTKVTDAAEGPYRKDAMHYVDGADAQEEFAYDANGNMTRNLDRHNAEEINHYSPCGALMDIGGRIILTESNISIKKLHRLIFYS